MARNRKQTADPALPLDLPLAKAPQRANDAGRFGQIATVWLSLAVIAAGAVAVYSNSLRCPFVYDDLAADVVPNAMIRHLWPPWEVLLTCSGTKIAPATRPVVQLSFAVNYTMGGFNTMPYHATNLAIHLLAGWTLFGFVRRTLLLPKFEDRFHRAATPLALTVSCLWTLHPLQTQAVTYIAQRYESMMGLFFLLALYSVSRCGDSPAPGRWVVAAVTCVLMALGCKEVAVSLPLIVLLYDRVFLAGSFAQAWRQRRGMYLGLLAVWLAFAASQVMASDRSQWAGFGMKTTWWEYLLSQPGVILHYLRLSFWPHPLVLDYGWPVARTAGAILPGLAVVGGLALAAIWALWRRPEWGFLGVCFFLILAPTSSFMPVADLCCEHRMYLPLAAVVIAVVLGGYAAATSRLAAGLPAWVMPTLCGGVAVVALGLAITTWQRNRDYETALSIWQDTVAKVPGNWRAQDNLSDALFHLGRFEDAVACARQALKFNDDSAPAYYNLGASLARLGKTDEALACYEKALEIDSDYIQAHTNLGANLANRGRHEQAIVHFRRAIELDSHYALAYNNLGLSLTALGRIDEALQQFHAAVLLAPQYAMPHYNLGKALTLKGRLLAAAEQFQQALAINPTLAEAHNDLAWVYHDLRQDALAAHHWQEAVRLEPNFEPAIRGLGLLLTERAWILATSADPAIGNPGEAVELAEQAVRQVPECDPDSLDALAAAYAAVGRFPEAVETALVAQSKARRRGAESLCRQIGERLRLYATEKPFRKKP
jgi:tetratricopeptide (TPR) repeat protein